MDKKYEQLINAFKESCEDTVINIYFGDVSGIYIGKSIFGENLTINNLISNGKLSMASTSDGFGYEVSDADYVCITTLKDGKEELKPVLSKIDVFFDDHKFLDFIDYLDKTDFSITQELFEKCSFDNSIGNYKREEAFGFKIYPSSEIIEKNKTFVSKVKIRK